MKPHPSIFAAALQRLGVTAAEAVMVGDSFRHDIEGALAAGMRAVLLNRGDAAAPAVHGSARVPTIHSLRELPELL
jgi:putative hydrolase of the HAD superfamily